ncbi:D-alanine--D-alanine ligase [Pendulispora albinea]|uniref:D-alanine--D-alanine ligase n=1 Tax=Pendulispora albinea TaxID=2741071 RepID=A0ABZ2M898_9BACT
MSVAPESPSRLRVAVIQGGPSSEAGVSRASAAAVHQALTEAGHDVTRLELDTGIFEALLRGKFDVVHPAVHGAVGEDGCLQGVLEVLGLAYVGSDVKASAVAMDKVYARRQFELAELPVARGISLSRDAEKTPRAAAEFARQVVGASVVVKPSASGSAVGVSRHEADAPDAQVAAAIEAVWELGDAALVEHFAHGREVTCGVLDLQGEQAYALPPTEILAPNDAFYTFEARYAPGRSVHRCPAPLGDELTRRVQELALQAHRALGCRDLSRVDFVVGDGADASSCIVLEVNTLPGFTSTSLYPEAAAAVGIPFPRLCDALVRSAHRRGPSRRNAPLAFPGAVQS